MLRLNRPQVIAGQLRHLLALTDSPHATVRVIPKDAVFYETRGHQFDVLSFAGTADRIGVSYSFLGAQLASERPVRPVDPHRRTPRPPT